MRLILAQSEDNFLAKNADDDMAWTGRTDKQLFRLLTFFSGEVLLAGKTTFDLLPPLQGRTTLCLSRSGLDLSEAAVRYPDATLIGGPTIALEALRLGLIHQFALHTVPVRLGSGVSSLPLIDMACWQFAGIEQAILGDLSVRVFYGRKIDRQTA